MTEKDGEADARQEAAHWHARLQTLPVAPETTRDFLAWHSLPGHADAFREVEQVDDAVGRLADRPSIQSLTEAAYHRGHDRHHGGRRRAAWASACVALLVAGGALLAPWSSHDKAYSTGIGQTHEVALEDGSIVRLDTDTEVSTHFTRHARHVRLTRGQAYFTVAHNAELPFIVDAGSASVTATGTVFDVRRTGNRTNVTLVRGGVDVRSADSVSHLISGQELRVVPGQKLLPETANMAVSTAWTRGRLVLDGVPLSRAIAEVDRYTDHPVRLDDPAYADAKFSGSLTTGDIPGFVAAVTAVLPLKAVTDQAGSVHLTGQGGSELGYGIGAQR